MHLIKVDVIGRRTSHGPDCAWERLIPLQRSAICGECKEGQGLQGAKVGHIWPRADR